MKKLFPALRDYLLITLGAFLQAVGLRLFLIPAKLAGGGVSGVAQLINHFTDWQIGLMVLIGNIPLFLLGWRFLGGRKFIIRTALAVVTFSFFIDALTYFLPTEGITDDILLNALYGAVVCGIGFGIVYRGQGTSGGSDILARILNQWRGIPITQSYMIVDSAVIIAAGFIFGWKEALYALITLYVSGIVTETAAQGVSVVRTALIITAEPQAVAQKIFGTLDRGVTLLSGKGAYTGAERTVLYCVVTRTETMRLKRLVNEIDEHAFMVIGQAHEALGEGFTPLDKE
jgi:uncharacterized membrane-anchored protein YitT (DUF2179 family)